MIRSITRPYYSRDDRDAIVLTKYQLPTIPAAAGGLVQARLSARASFPGRDAPDATLVCSMKSDTEQWAVKDKTRLLLSIMEALAGDAHLSPEGDLHGFPVMAIPGASDAETPALKRNRLLFVLVCARLDDFEAPWALAAYSSDRSTSISPILLCTS